MIVPLYIKLSPSILGHKTQKVEAARSATSTFWVLVFLNTSDPDNFLKVPQSDTFKKLSGFYGRAKRCS
jgi:hypothetical protein